MSCCSWSFHMPKALPSLPSHQRKNTSVFIASKQKQYRKDDFCIHQFTNFGIQAGAFLATVAQPALAITGVNDEEDLTWILIQSGISAFIYFLIFPPIILNWLRTRWFKRDLLEMYLQFMFVFMFFPGILLWAPFLNFRKFPRDPSMKYPWSTPKDPSKMKNSYRKYPWATLEDYEQP